MDCPFCNSFQLSVINSRPNIKIHGIWRRRRCLKCHKTFTTSETADLSMKTVVKKSGKRQSFDRNKLYLGVYRATNETRDLSKAESKKVTDEAIAKITRALLKKPDVVSSAEIGEEVLVALKQISWEAYLRFLAYYDPKRIQEALT